MGSVSSVKKPSCARRLCANRDGRMPMASPCSTNGITVEEVRTDDSGLTQYAVVQPNVRPESLVQVFVITAFDIVD